ncbi:MAG TPA: PQQ-dependent sugar dehydrogenase, partial [Solirubrobacteraceae bacterium]|nr:PQQ-dependent sugar dehydrogenase [Solirubrobacteraceae bacterium]
MAAALAAGAFLCSTAGAAANLPAGFDQQALIPGLTRPTAVAWAPDGRMFIAEKDGVVRVADANGVLQPDPLIDISDQVATLGDRGLLGIAVDTSYASNHYIYLLYTYRSNPDDFNGPAVAKLRRVVVNPDNSLGAQQVILGTYDPGTPSFACPQAANDIDCIPSDSSTHSIGTVRSDPDGSLWVGSGDAAEFGGVDQKAFRTYDESSLAGKILHIDRDGHGLAGHAFCTSDADLSHVCTKVYAKGFRNPFRFTLRGGGLGPAVGDVGWNSWEELDMLQGPGGDYGWPCWEATHQTPDYSADPQCNGAGGEYTKPVQMPVFENPHTALGGDGVAIIGGLTYTGSDFPDGYAGTTFFGDYGSGILRRYDPTTGDTTDFATGASPWVDLEAAPPGLSYAHASDLIYVNIGATAGDGEGEVGRVFDSVGSRTPVARASGTPLTVDPGLPVSFKGDTSRDPDGEGLVYDWDFGDGSAHSKSANPTHTYGAYGAYTARLTVSDTEKLSSVASVHVTVGGPRVQIADPKSATPYQDGNAVPLNGSAHDFFGKVVTDLRWHVILHHSTSHIHDIGTFPGSTPSFTTLTSHSADSSYDVTLTATDSNGLAGSQTVTIHPQTVGFSLASSPPGAPVGYAGTAQTAPFSTNSAVGFETSVSAAGQFTSNGTTYAFSSWSDGGAIGHNITIPAASTTLTATYAAQNQTSAQSPLSVGTAGKSAPLDHRGPDLRLGTLAAELRRGRLT